MAPWARAAAEGEPRDPTPSSPRPPPPRGEYERIDWARVHARSTLASSYCVRKGLTRKAQLAVNLKKWVAKRPASPLAPALPETYVLQVDDVDYIEEAMADIPEVRDAEAGAGRWVVKPSVANRAAGVAVIDSAPALAAALAAQPNMREWVVQRYVDPPALLGGRKWHARVYALAVGALDVFALTDGLALRARAPYAGAGLDDLDAHLTNTCRAAGGEAAGGESGDDDGAPPPPRPAPVPLTPDEEADTILLLSELPDALVADGMGRREAEAKVAGVLAATAALVGETFAAVASELSFFALPSAFELFGFDFLVAADWTVWLLEVNADPDVGATGARCAPLARALVEGALRLTADTLAAKAGGGGGGGRGGGGAGGAEWRRVFSRDAGRTGASGMVVS